MEENFEDNPFAQPELRKKSGISLVWIIPIVTALVGGWLVFRTLADKGAEIVISFNTAEGIEAGKTKIKYKDVTVGFVHTLDFDDDYSNVILKATINKEAIPFLRRDTRFWVVKPRMTIRGISNASTLLSGVYIAMEPGYGASHRSFIGLETIPRITADEQGTEFMLLADNLGSLDTGSPIYYQGILVGKVLGYELGNDRKSIFVHGFVEQPYDELLQSNTQFWNVSGVDVVMDADGMRVQTESLQSFLFGGIAFENPDAAGPVSKDVSGLVFTLYNDYESVVEESYYRKGVFALYFEESIRGLKIGAPVELNGIKVGAVTDTQLEYIAESRSFRSRVLIELEPERVQIIGDKELNELSLKEEIQFLVEKGLRAILETGSLLTGQLYVSLEMSPQDPIRLVSDSSEYMELPTIPSTFEYLEVVFKNILAELDRLEIDKIGIEALGVIQGTNHLMNHPDLSDSIHEFKESLQSFTQIMKAFEGSANPIFRNLSQALGAGNQALQKSGETMDLVNRLLKPDSPFQYEFNKLTAELTETARSIRALVDMMERYPNSVIFGKPEQDE